MVIKVPPHSRRSLPSIPVGHPDYVWKSHSDVQATWMRLTNWRPIHSNQPPKYVEPVVPLAFVKLQRRK